MIKFIWFDKSILHTRQMDALYGEIEQMYITAYGIPSYRKSRYGISCVCANLVYAARHSNKIYVSRDKDTYKPSVVNGAIQQLNLGYSSMIKILDMLEDYRIIKSTKGHKYFTESDECITDLTKKAVLHKSLGYIELTEFGEELIMSKVDIMSVTNKPRSSLLVLMDTKKELMCYEETEEAKSMMQLVDQYNKFMAKQLVESGDGDLLHTSLSRIFSRGDAVNTDNKFVFGGRFYGEGTNYQQLPQMDRKRIKINNEPVFELDFKCIHISIHCSKEGITLPEGYDVYSQYDTSNYVLDPDMIAMATAWYKHDYNPYREFEKLAWLILINCGKRSKTIKQNRQLAIKTLGHKLEEDAKEEKLHLRKFIGIKSVNIEGVINNIETKSAVGRDLLYSDKGIELMKDDSDIMQIILTTCINNEIPVLCVHDSVIVPQSKLGKVMEIMKSAYAQVCGTEDNCVITIK